MKDLTFITFGFVSGAVIGFAWAQEAKASLADNVTTSIDDGVVTVKADILTAGLDGLRGLIQ